MTVNDILVKIRQIDRLDDLYEDQKLKADDFDDLVGLIREYREELLHKKVIG